MVYKIEVSVVYAIIDQTVRILYIWNNQQDHGRLLEVLKMSSHDK